MWLYFSFEKLNLTFVFFCLLTRQETRGPKKIFKVHQNATSIPLNQKTLKKWNVLTNLVECVSPGQGWISKIDGKYMKQQEEGNIESSFKI